MFREIYRKYEWKPIRDCPGRFILKQGMSESPPEDICPSCKVHTFITARSRDPVLVAKFEDGGLISYKKSENEYLHTLGDASGFERKLRDLQIDLPD